MKLSGMALIVDDEEDIRELLRMSFEKMGLEVDEAADGRSALEKVKNNCYDIVCSDMHMPNMNGEEFVIAAREYATSSVTKYYFITGGLIDGSSVSQKGNLRELVDGFILKPFTDASIYEVLSKSKAEDKAS